MKFLMTILMAMTLSQVFAGECKLNGECSDEKACHSLNLSFAFKDGKCIDPTSGEKSTQCSGIVNSSANKVTTDSDKKDSSSSDGKIK